MSNCSDIETCPLFQHCGGKHFHHFLYAHTPYLQQHGKKDKPQLSFMDFFHG